MKRLFVMLAALAVLVAACGGTTSETTAANDASVTGASDGTNTSEGDSTESSDSSNPDEIDLGDDGELTLQDFIPGAFSFDENTDFRSEEMQIQQTIAACMAEEGFEYIPFVPTDIGGGFGFDEFDEEEYVKTYGFGVATWILQEEQFVYDEDSDPYANDPNQEIVDAMDEFEMEEYYRVLHGGEPDIITNTPPEELEAMSEEELMAFYDEAYADWQPDGCYNEAYEEAYGGGEADQAFWEEFGQDFEDMYSRAESDPRIVKAQADWSACMAEKGHDYATQDDMYGYFYGTESAGQWVEGEFQQKVNEVVTYPDYGFGEGVEEDSSGGVATTVGGVVEGEDGEYEYYGPEYDIEELQPLIDEEIAVAVANYECSKDMRDLFTEVYEDLEKQFIEENLDRLMAFREANA